MNRNKILKSESLRYWLYQTQYEAVSFKAFWTLIKEVSAEKGINPNLLLGVIAIEKTQKSIIDRFAEFIIACVGILVSLFDISLGIAQIKQKTLKKELNIHVCQKALLNKKNSIILCSELLAKYSKSIDFNTSNPNDIDYGAKLLIVVKKYTTGNYNYPTKPWILFYSCLLEAFIKKKLL
jgi:hypothetical protein